MFNLKDVQEFSAMKPEPRKEGCRLKGVRREKDEKNPNTHNSFVITYVDSTGAALDQREFVPKRFPQSTEEDFRKQIRLTVSRLAHVAKAFLPPAITDKIGVADPDNLNLVEQNFIDITNQIGKALMDLLKEAEAKKDYAALECALKVVYKESGGKYYSSLPAVPPFISTKLHPKEFQDNPQYDIYIIPAGRPDKEARKDVPDQGQSAFGGGFGDGFGGSNVPPPPTETGGGFGASQHESGF